MVNNLLSYHSIVYNTAMNDRKFTVIIETNNAGLASYLTDIAQNTDHEAKAEVRVNTVKGIPT